MKKPAPAPIGTMGAAGFERAPEGEWVLLGSTALLIELLALLVPVVRVELAVLEVASDTVQAPCRP